MDLASSFPMSRNSHRLHIRLTYTHRSPFQRPIISPATKSLPSVESVTKLTAPAGNSRETEPYDAQGKGRKNFLSIKAHISPVRQIHPCLQNKANYTK